MPTPISKLKGLLNSGLIKVITAQLNRIGDEARRLAKTERIKRNIQVLPVEVHDRVLTATIRVDASDTGAPEALAYEYGSGIWGREGKKYPIEPKEKDALAFLWPDAASIAQREGVTKVNFGEGGKVVLPRVMHPGVKAEPYLAPAVAKYEVSLLGGLADISAAILADATVPAQVIIAK